MLLDQKLKDTRISEVKKRLISSALIIFTDKTSSDVPGLFSWLIYLY